MPCLGISLASVRSTSRDVCLRATSIAKHARVYSSTLGCQKDNVCRQCRFVARNLWCVALRPPDLAQNPTRLLENGDIQGLVRNQTLQAPILLFKLFQSTGLINAQTPVFLPPAIVGLLADVQLAHDLCDGLALGHQDLGLPQVTDDLLC